MSLTAMTIRAYELSGRRMMPRVRFAVAMARCTMASACVCVSSEPARGPARYSLSAQRPGMGAKPVTYAPAALPACVPAGCSSPIGPPLASNFSF